MTRPMMKPFAAGRLSFRSRVVMPPILERFASADGYVTEQQCRFYSDRVRDGVGLAIIGGMAVSNWAKYRPGGLHVYDDSYIAGLKRLAETVHAAGAKVGAQLQHAGRMVADPPQPGNRTAGPSSMADTLLSDHGVVGLTIQEIEGVVRDFASAAARVREAGFDVVEIHASHGYLLSAFLSPFTNLRNDAYGGDVQRRARLLCDIVDAVRATMSETMALCVRLNGTDFVTGGTTLEDTIEHARLLAARGIDLIHITAGTPDVFDHEFPLGFSEPGCYRSFARAVRDDTGVPTIVVGRINTPAVADDIIASGDADLVAIARALIADPDFVRKAAAGADSEIRPCIGCNACVDKEPGPFPATPCSVNYLAGRETFIPITQASVRKRVLIVGAGPAGLEAARVAARRGHVVTVVERSGAVGGQMAIAGGLSHKKDFARWIRYAEADALSAGAAIRLGTELTPSLVEDVRPDFAILATGAEPGVLDIAGAELPHVVQAIDILRGRCTPGRRVVIVGATRIGLVTAEHLAGHGHAVAVVEAGTEIAAEMGYTFKKGLVRRLSEKGVVIETGTRVLRTGPGFIQILKKGYLVGGRSELADRPVDTIVVATQRHPVRDASAQLDSAGIPWVAVGDCVEPRRIINAIHEASRAASLL